MKRPVTPRGYATMRQDLKKFRAMRPEIAMAIEIARGHGDLSENGDYDAAKEKSGMVEAKIRDLEARLAHAEIVDPSRYGELTRVVFGCTVTIEDVESGDKKTLSLVGPDEGDIDRGWISVESPMGRALIGRESGDVTRVALPGGAREFEVQEISVDAQQFAASEAEIGGDLEEA